MESIYEYIRRTGTISIPLKKLFSWAETVPLKEILEAADTVKQKYAGTGVELCSILNARSGRCSEDCAFCAQSAWWNTHCAPKPLISFPEALYEAQQCEAKGVHRFSLVTSGRCLSVEDMDHLCRIYEGLASKTSLRLCGSHGLITEKQARQLASAGVSRYHCNLETGPNFFPSICSTHTIEDKLKTLSCARRAGLELCSGGIMGLGETLQDRLEMASLVAQAGAVSFPLNILTPIPGTPLQNCRIPQVHEILLSGALIRFLLPHVTLRYAGGRKALGVHVVEGLHGGINGLLTGDYLTTTGRSIEEDLKMITSAGLSARVHDTTLSPNGLLQREELR
ncbi:MAG TPA: biotin synthase BioB [Aminobacterium sp.]|jgi:biotin synthase|uniref:biotin synthase BioB n=1 Tax=Aminobacterium TaxID=81466 RepID=UPI000EC9E0D2|nr:biotin synthase BioB [Aminobacterium sp. UBA4834]HCA40313.1 biotin synthase BioB [Aminobacterium sp.]